VAAEVGWRAQAGRFADLLDRECAGFQEFAGALDSLRVQPLDRGGPGDRTEVPDQRALGQVRVPGDDGDRQRFVQMRAHPVEHRRETGVVAWGCGGIDVLGLSAIAVCRRDQAPG